MAEAKTFDAVRHPRQLNLGCGFDRREGCLNVDLHPFHHPDLVCDVLDLAPLPDGFYEHALAQDVLEHLPRLKTRTALTEWNRVLAVGGLLELRVPDVLGLARLLELPENQLPERQEELLQNLFGTQLYPGDFHYIGFTEPFLRALLEECGFAIEQLAREEGWLFHVVALKLRDVRRNPLLAIADDAEFVRAAYRDLLGREADPGGFDYHFRLLAEGASRESILGRFTSSEEYRARRAVGT
jgi:predicted SAM-dependent methyltransferase